MLSGKLSKDDKEDIAAIVVAKLQGTPVPTVKQEDPTPGIETIVTDPLVATADAKYDQLIKDLPTGSIIVKGRRGAQMINQSAESANLIEEILNKKKHRFTRNNLY